MPTLEHNGLIEMFRENPSLAPHFLSLLFHVEVPSHASVRVADTALDQLIPVEFRADLVLELRDDEDHVVFAIVLEAQRDQEPRKRYSWPVYVAVARAERECPTVALVIAIDAGVATWAAEKIDFGLGLGGLQPLVLGPATVPVVTDPELAEREVELAILSAMAHGNGPDGLVVVRYDPTLSPAGRRPETTGAGDRARTKGPLRGALGLPLDAQHAVVTKLASKTCSATSPTPAKSKPPPARSPPHPRQA
jgi:hypothetical protein